MKNVKGIEKIESVQDVITKRYSVRSYDKKPVEQEIRKRILAYTENLENPLESKIIVHSLRR